jgi:GNAT superfamily N-acetyltransferase
LLTIAQVKTAADIAAMQELIREYTTWAFKLEAKSHEAPTFADLEEELATLPGEFAAPDGRLLLAKCDGKPAGCIALKRHDSTTCELKRFYVRPGFRGLGIGKSLVQQLLDEARRSGYRRMVLDSHHTMKKAHDIYVAFGFKRVSAPSDFPEELIPVVVFMEADLSDIC